MLLWLYLKHCRKLKSLLVNAEQNWIRKDSDTCDVPKVYIAKMQFDRMKDWTKGCSPSNHSLFYNAIHGNSWTPFWGLQKVEKQEHDLTDLTQKNYKDVIFGTIEKMAK